MFFQGIIGILLLIGFAFGIWKLIVKPLLEGAGIQVDAEAVEKLTEYQMRRDALSLKLDNLTKDAEAAEDIGSIEIEMIDLKDQIKTVEDKIKEMKKS
jgi:hypothetical protein